AHPHRGDMPRHLQSTTDRRDYPSLSSATDHCASLRTRPILSDKGGHHSETSQLASLQFCASRRSGPIHLRNDGGSAHSDDPAPSVPRLKGGSTHSDE